MKSLIKNPSDCSKYKYLLFVVTKTYDRNSCEYDFDHEIFGYKTKEELSEHIKEIVENDDNDVEYSVIENHAIIKPMIKTIVEF